MQFSAIDLSLGITGIVSSGDPVLVQANLDLTCMAPGIPVELLPGANIVWLNPEVEAVTSVDTASSLVLELEDLGLEDSGNYTCRLEIVSVLLDGGSVTIDSVFNLQVQRKTGAIMHDSKGPLFRKWFRVSNALVEHIIRSILATWCLIL